MRIALVVAAAVTICLCPGYLSADPASPSQVNVQIVDLSFKFPEICLLLSLAPNGQLRGTDGRAVDDVSQIVRALQKERDIDIKLVVPEPRETSVAVVGKAIQFLKGAKAAGKRTSIFVVIPGTR